MKKSQVDQTRNITRRCVERHQGAQAKQKITFQFAWSARGVAPRARREKMRGKTGGAYNRNRPRDTRPERR